MFYTIHFFMSLKKWWGEGQNVTLWSTMEIFRRAWLFSPGVQRAQNLLYIEKPDCESLRAWFLAKHIDWAVSQECGHSIGIGNLLWISLKNPTLKKSVTKCGRMDFITRAGQEETKSALTRAVGSCQKSLVFGGEGDSECLNIKLTQKGRNQCLRFCHQFSKTMLSPSLSAFSSPHLLYGIQEPRGVRIGGRTRRATTMILFSHLGLGRSYWEKEFEENEKLKFC